MKILGIDPGFERLGVAIIEKAKGKKEIVLFSDCFKTSPKLPFAERLELVGKEVERVIEEYSPEVLAIETLFLNTNQKTAMRVAEVRGVIIYEAMRAKLKVFEASPPQIKMAITGYGRADKKQIMKMVEILTGLGNTKRKNGEKTRSDDELDAVAIALTAGASIR